MTTSTKTISIISLFTLACMSGWVSAATVNTSLSLNNKIESSQQVNSSDNQVESDAEMSNQLAAQGNAQADVPDENAELESDGTQLVAADEAEGQEAPTNEAAPEASMDDVAQRANLTSALSAAADTNTSLVAEALSQADVSNALTSTVNQTLELETAADSAAQATEQLNLAVQDTVSATTRTLVQQNVNGQVSDLVSEQVTTAVQAETATEITQSIVANIGL